MILAGITDASYRDFSPFGVWPLPRFGTGDIAVRRRINEWHELAAHLTIMVAALRKLPRGAALRRAGLRVENCTYGQPYDQYAESTGSG